MVPTPTCESAVPSSLSSFESDIVDGEIEESWVMKVRSGMSKIFACLAFISRVCVREKRHTQSALAAHKSMHLLSNISPSDGSVKTKRRWRLVDYMLDRTLFEGATGLNFHNDVFSLNSTSVWEGFKKKQNAFEMTYRLARSSRLTFFVPIGWSDGFGACFISLAAVPSQVLQTGHCYYHLRFGLHKSR